MKCKKCKKEISDNAKFCPHCGTPVSKSGGEKLASDNYGSPKTPGIRRFVMMGALILLFMGGFAWFIRNSGEGRAFFTFLDGESETLGNLTSENVYLPVDDRVESRFMIQVRDDQEELCLYGEENTVVSDMYDDGTHGDEKAGDGIYTCTVTLESDEADTVRYYVKAGKNKSNPVDIQYFGAPTEDMVSEMEAIEEHLKTIEQEFADGEGYISEEEAADVLEEAAAYVKELHNKKQILEYEINEDNILLRFRSGILYMYSPQVKGLDGTGEDAAVSVITCQPFRDSYSYEVASYMGLPDAAAGKLDQAFDRCIYSEKTNYDMEEVTLDLIRSFSANQIILWHGHGMYSSEYHSILLTGETYDWKYLFRDAIKGAVVLVENWRIGITSEYIDEYCGDLSNSFIYLGACRSGMDSALADSFLNKNAAAVVANSDTIYTAYDLLMLHSVVENMTVLNAGTKNYNTLSEALALAKKTYGADDSKYGRKAEVAEALIFGGERAKQYRVAEYEPIDEDSLLGILEEYTSEPVLNFLYDDFDGNAAYEAIAFCGRQDEFDGSYIGVFYLVTEDGVQIIRDFDGYWDAGKLYDFGTAKIFAITQYFTTGGITSYYQLDEGVIREIDGSGIGDGLYQDEDGRMCMTDSQCDAGVDGSGHTWNVYYFYWDDGLKEYGGTPVTAEEFLAYEGAGQILEQIEADGYEVVSIYQRKNGIININCCDGIWNRNVRAVYSDGKVEVSPITEGYYYEEGIIKPALNEEIATY